MTQNDGSRESIRVTGTPLERGRSRCRFRNLRSRVFHSRDPSFLRDPRVEVFFTPA